MGQRRRQLREELERREKGVVNGSGGLGPGGEARMEAERRKAKVEELKKYGEAQREQRGREQTAAWKAARAKAKRRGESAGAPATDDDLEERTARVKWKRRESHSDYTLSVIFERFGEVESVSIEAGTGNRALITFASAAAVDAAVAAYKDDENMRASYVGKRRPKRPAFASRPVATQSTSAPTAAAAAAAAPPSMSSFRDRESVVMMMMRQEAERQALIRKMAQEEGTGAGKQNEGGVGVESRNDGGGVTQDGGGGASRKGAAGVGAACGEASSNPGGANLSGSSKDAKPDGSPGLNGDRHIGGVGRQAIPHAPNPAVSTPSAEPSRSSGAGGVVDNSGPSASSDLPRASPDELGGGAVSTLRAGEGDVLSAVKEAGDEVAPSSPRSRMPGRTEGSERAPPAKMGTEATVAVGAVDENDILSRMMRFKR